MGGPAPFLLDDAVADEALRGRGTLRLPLADLARLGLATGAPVAVIGARRTHARVLPTGSGRPAADPLVLANAGAAATGLRIEAAAVRDAESVEIEAVDGRPAPGDGLRHRVLTTGDTLSLAGGRGTVVRTAPDGPVVVGAATRVSLLGGADGYGRVGGLDGELARVRELVEATVLRGDAVARLGIEPPRGVLLSGPPGTGKTLVARAVAESCGARFLSIAGPEIVSKHYGDSEAELRAVFERAAREAPSVVFIDEIDAIAPRREGLDGGRQLERRLVAQLLTLLDGLTGRGPVVVLAATNRPDDVDGALRRPGRFDREVVFSAPDPAGRRAVLGVHTRRMPLAADVDLDRIAAATHGFVGADLAALSREAGMAALRRDPAAGSVAAADFDEALVAVRPSALREAAVDVRPARFSDVGGLDGAKAALTEAVLLPLRERPLYDRFGIRPPRGILLSGPPGTGKTLLVRALAGEAGVNLLVVKGGELLDRHVGESEAAVRRLFAKARQTAPTLVFFDELDALAPARGAGDGGVMDRVVAALLTEIDGVEELKGVFLVGATNRADRIDRALLRPGRFDAVVPVPVPDAAERAAILALHARRLPLDAAAAKALADAAEGFVGADLELLAKRLGTLCVRRAAAGADPAVGAAEALSVLSAVRDERSALAGTSPS